MLIQKIEEGCFEKVAALPRFTSSLFSVGTPKSYEFNEEFNNQILEYLPQALSMKEYALKNWMPPSTPKLEAQGFELGRSIGSWLKTFHNWSAHPEQIDLRALVAKNGFMQELKYHINSHANVSNVGKFPDALGGAKAVFEELAALAKDVLKVQSQLRVIHGDFWTGK